MRRSQNASLQEWTITGRSSHIRVRHLCNDCNSGWMSDLENKIRPLLGPLMNDLSFRLDPAQQSLIATWGMKTAMVFQCMGVSREWFYSKAEREHLRSRLSLPANTVVWLGRYERSDISLCEARRLHGPVGVDPTVLRDGYVTTLAVGRLVMQILTLRLTPAQRGPRRDLQARPSRWDQALIQIWPATRLIYWPPTLSLNEPTLASLNERFRSSPGRR